MKPLKHTTNDLQQNIRTVSTGFEHSFKLWLVLVFTAFVIALLLSSRASRLTASAATFSGFPYSTPITLNNTGTQLWVTNPDPDNNSVTVLDATNDQGSVLREIKVGNEPNSIAINGNDSLAYVANTLSGNVTYINTTNFNIIGNIRVGVEPRALCFTPNFSKLYVACASSNDIYVINPASNQVVKVIQNPAINGPFALTITNDGDNDDTDELVYVTNLLADYAKGAAPKPADDLGKEGVVNVVNVGTDTVVDEVRLKPVQTTFQSDGRSRNASLSGLPADQKADTSAFPNMLTAITGTRQNGQNLVYTFATGSSPTGPVRFNVILQSLVSLIKGGEDANQTRNLNDEIRGESQDPFANGVPRHRFATMPWGLAFYHNSFKALGISSACDYAVVMSFDQNGKATIAPNGAANIKRILTGTQRDADANRSIFTDGKVPRGVVINQNDTRAYTFNYVSRDVTIMDLVNDVPIRTVATTASKGDAKIQLGKELFNTAMGPIDNTNKNPDGSVSSKEGRMADFGWCACVSCHINGLTDGVVWGFPSGPRTSVPLNWTFAPKKGNPTQRSLNWSSIFDEVADFELNTRNVAGGVGLIQLANGDADANVRAFDPASANRDARRDAITEYVKTIRSPLAPFDDNDPDVVEGRRFFKKVGCIQCHNSALWTSSRLDFPAPPPAAELIAGQLKGQLENVGTFDASKPHEVIGTGATLNQTALGVLGFNVPSLLGVHSQEKFMFHDGSLVSFQQLFDNPAHVGVHPKLKKQAVRDKLIKFLKSIDDDTVPFN
jgi:YVTN family beta-propeller protein